MERGHPARQRALRAQARFFRFKARSRFALRRTGCPRSGSTQEEGLVMQLDIRLPIGLMFALLGALLTGFGLIAEKGFYQKSLGINVDAWWGLVMLIFGVIMFLLG